MVKVIYVTKNLAANGITGVVMNYGIHLDKSQFKLDVITGAPVESIYREKLENNNIKVIDLPPKRKNPVAYYQKMWRQLKKGYDIIHIHGNSATITVELMMAKLAGIKVRIAHSHNVTCDHKRIHHVLQPLMRKLYTYGFACSKAAGKWMFGKGAFEVLPNAFQTEKFIFNEVERIQVRKSLGISDKYVIGNVARFNDQKNHEYLLKVFEKVAEKREDAVLLLVGNGPNLEKIQKKIAEHPYKDRIIYYGITDKVAQLYAAMDVFVLPTKYEGLGIVFVEAQINGLPVVTSDQVPREVNIADRAVFLPLTEDVSAWCKSILNAPQTERKEFYASHKSSIEAYNISRCACRLKEKYETFINNI